MKTSVFQLTQEMQALEDLIAEFDGDIDSPAAQEAIESWFKELEGAQGEKIDACRGMLRYWGAGVATAKAMIDQYQKDKQVLENRITKMKERLKQYALATKQTKIVTPEGGSLQIIGNGGVQPIMPDNWADGLDPTKLEPRFQKIVLNAEAVRFALEQGEVLPFAALGARGCHVRIR